MIHRSLLLTLFVGSSLFAGQFTNEMLNSEQNKVIEANIKAQFQKKKEQDPNIKKAQLDESMQQQIEMQKQQYLDIANTLGNQNESRIKRNRDRKIGQ